MPKEAYRRVRITTVDDNVVLDHLALFEKRISDRLKAMEQEIRDLRSLLAQKPSQEEQSLQPNESASESEAREMHTPVRKLPAVIPAEPIDVDEPVNAEIKDDDDQEKNSQILDEKLRTVIDVVREWTQGLAPGKPPLKELAKDLNQNWGFSTLTQRELFYERETIYSEVVFIAEARQISEADAAVALESHRTWEGYSLKTLARLIKSHQRRREREKIDRTPYI